MFGCGWKQFELNYVLHESPDNKGRPSLSPSLHACQHVTFLWIVASMIVYSTWEMVKLFQYFCHLTGKSNMKWDRHRKVTYKAPSGKDLPPHLQGVWSTDRLYWSVSSISVSAVGNHFSQCHILPKMTWGCWLCNVGLKRACCFSLAQNKSDRQHLL